MANRKFQFIILLCFILLSSVLLNIEDVHAKFTDVTTAAGLGQVGPSYGSPVWGDLNNDGYLDLIVPRHGSMPSIYQNNRLGTFTDILNLSGITPTKGADRHGWALGDYDNDGKLDLFISSGGCRGICVGGKKDELWKGDGLGNFTDVYTLTGVLNPSGRGRSNNWIDYNNDGFLDLFILNYKTLSILYKNNGDGTFSDVTTSSGLSNISGVVSSWADFNNDGTMDLLVTGNMGDHIYKNNPATFTFSDVSAQAGLLPINGTGGAWGDFNNDGHLDIYIARGKNILPNSIKWNASKITFGDEEEVEDGIDFITTGNNVTFDLYLNTRRNRNKVFIGSYKTNPTSIPFSLSGTDILNLGKPSYIPSTDEGFFIWKDTLGIWHLRYCGNNKFPTYYGVLTSDGNFTSVTTTFKRTVFKYKDTLYKNNGNGTFTDVTGIAGVGKLGNHISAIWGDYNNDGFLDLYVPDLGDISGGSPNLLYRNNGNGTFLNTAVYQGVDASAASTGKHFGASWGDYNNDGFIDLFLKNGAGTSYPLAVGPDILFKNSGTAGNWLKINLIGYTSNRLGIGAKLTLVANGKMQYQQYIGGSGESQSQGSNPIHFGLGTDTIIDSLTIKWPSGRIQTLTNIGANQAIKVVE